MATAMNDLMTADQVAELRGCSGSLVRRHCRKGTLPALNMAGVWLIRRSHALAFTPQAKAGRPPKKTGKNSLA